jgi:hypothetical protein
MADIFLSYAREDEPKAELIATVLAARGWSVWWDRRIPYGNDFNTAIQQQLDAARCVLVLWSQASVASKFVRDEATEGLNGRLVPVLVEDVRQPLGFRQLQAADLSDWDGQSPHEEWDRLIGSISSIVQPAAAAASRSTQVVLSAGPVAAPVLHVRTSRRVMLAGVAVVASALAVGYVAHQISSTNTTAGPPPASPSVADLEARLQAVNISLSTGTDADLERVRGYVRDPETPYRQLGEACVEVLNGRPLRERGYLDMIDKWYTQRVGSAPYLTSDGKIRLAELRTAMVLAHNDYHGGSVTTYEDLLK